MDYALFYEITSILLLAGVIALITSFFKQPSIIAFIITGLIAGPLGYYQLRQSDVLTTLGQIGITLLLFMVGLELDVQKLRQLGKVAVYTGLGQIIFTSIVGFLITLLLGFSVTESIYIAVALTFSSTIIVVKLLSEKGESQSLYARIVVGFLVVQDFVAMGILLLLGSENAHDPITAGLPQWQGVIISLVKGLILFLLLYLLSKKVFPKILKYMGSSNELLLAFAIGWALGLAAFASLPFVGLSMETGGFLAGLVLANTTVHYEIGAKVKSIRDFFIILFFIVFGTHLVLSDVASITFPAIILSLFVIIGNPIIVLFIMGWLGYKPRTSFYASVTVAQVSEFSFIFVALGQRLGHLESSVVSLVTFVGIITIAVSSYMIMNAEKLYQIFKKPLEFFDFKRGSAEVHLENVELKNHIILIGAHRMGRYLIRAISKLPYQLVVVDFNPEIIEQVSGPKVNAVCGDITDSYIQEQVNLSQAKIIISTIPDFDSNITLLEAVNSASPNKKLRPKLIFAAQNEQEAQHLYNHEIDYALSPHFLGGLHLAKILKEDASLASLKKLKQHHLKAIVS